MNYTLATLLLFLSLTQAAPSPFVNPSTGTVTHSVACNPMKDEICTNAPKADDHVTVAGGEGGPPKHRDGNGH